MHLHFNVAIAVSHCMHVQSIIITGPEKALIHVLRDYNYTLFTMTWFSPTVFCFYLISARNES